MLQIRAALGKSDTVYPCPPAGSPHLPTAAKIPWGPFGSSCYWCVSGTLSPVFVVISFQDVRIRWKRCKLICIAREKSSRIGILKRVRHFLKSFGSGENDADEGDSTARTADQTRMGIFWAYDGGFRLGAPPRMFNQMMDVMVIDSVFGRSSQMATGYQLVKLYAAANIALADAGIAVRSCLLPWSFCCVFSERKPFCTYFVSGSGALFASEEQHPHSSIIEEIVSACSVQDKLVIEIM